MSDRRLMLGASVLLAGMIGLSAASAAAQQTQALKPVQKPAPRQSTTAPAAAQPIVPAAEQKVLPAALPAKSDTKSDDRPVAGDPADNAADERTRQAERHFNELNVRYAEIFVRLTKIDLQKAVDTNNKIAGLFSNAEILRLRQAVTTAEDRLHQARAIAGGKSGNGLIATAQLQLTTAEEDLQRGIAINNQVAGTVSPLDMEKLQLNVEMAKLNLGKAKYVAEANSPLLDLKWQFDDLREEVRRLRNRLETITNRR